MAGSTVSARLSHSRERAVAVAVMDALVTDLPVCGIAESTGLRGHERIGERLHHRAQPIRTRRSDIVFREVAGAHRRVRSSC